MKCEQCGSDGDMGNCNQWMLKLSAIECGSKQGAVTDFYILAPIAGDLYFCGLGCLDAYLESLKSEWKKTYNLK